MSLVTRTQVFVGNNKLHHTKGDKLEVMMDKLIGGGVVS